MRAAPSLSLTVLLLVFTAASPLWAVPSITCPADVTVFLGLTCDPQQVTYPPPVVTDTAFIGCAPPSGSVFPVGVTTVTCLADDPAPQSLFLSCDFTVSVLDTTPPTIQCPAAVDVESEADACGTIVEYAPTASDQCPGVTTEIQQGLPSGSLFPVGTISVQLRALDAFGNSASCGFTVEVTDTFAPQITCPADVTVPEPGPVQYGVLAEDACGVEVSLSQPSGSVFRAPRTVVGATARDPSGNVSSCSFAVVVGQTTTSTTLPPTAECPVAPTFASILCRLGALDPLVAAASSEPVRARLGRLLDRADELVRAAESSDLAGRRAATRTAIRKAVKKIRRLRKKALAPKSGLVDPARTAIADEADAVRIDLGTILGS